MEWEGQGFITNDTPREELKEKIYVYVCMYERGNTA